jgi:hypothetical protein
VIDGVRFNCNLNAAASALKLGMFAEVLQQTYEALKVKRVLVYRARIGTGPLRSPHPPPTLPNRSFFIYDSSPLRPLPRQVDPGNAKALYRRAQALRATHKYDEAKACLALARGARPHDLQLREEAVLLRSQVGSRHTRGGGSKRRLGRRLFRCHLILFAMRACASATF